MALHVIQLLIVAALATYRIASLFVEEDGPFDMFGKIRHAVGVRYDAQSERIANNEVAKVFNCVWCFSLWLGLIVAIAMYFAPELTYWLCMPFSLSAAAILLHERIKR